MNIGSILEPGRAIDIFRCWKMRNEVKFEVSGTGRSQVRERENFQLKKFLLLYKYEAKTGYFAKKRDFPGAMWSEMYLVGIIHSLHVLEWVLSSSLWWMTMSVCHLTPLHSHTHIRSYITGQTDSSHHPSLTARLSQHKICDPKLFIPEENSDKRKNIYEAAGIERRNIKQRRKYFTAFCKGWWISETKNKKEANRVKVWCLLYLENDPLYCSSLQNINLKKQTWKK